MDLWRIFGTYVAIVATVGFFLFALVSSFGEGKPVRYSWDSGRRCEVRESDGKFYPCTAYTKEELNRFRLEYTDPHRKLK